MVAYPTCLGYIPGPYAGCATGEMLLRDSVSAPASQNRGGVPVPCTGPRKLNRSLDALGINDLIVSHHPIASVYVCTQVHVCYIILSLSFMYVHAGAQGCMCTCAHVPKENRIIWAAVPQESSSRSLRTESFSALQLPGQQDSRTCLPGTGLTHTDHYS